MNRVGIEQHLSLVDGVLGDDNQVAIAAALAGTAQRAA